MRKWPKEQEEFLIENYAELGLNECSKRLNKSISSIKAKAFKLGLKFRTTGLKSGRSKNWTNHKFDTGSEVVDYSHSDGNGCVWNIKCNCGKIYTCHSCNLKLGYGQLCRFCELSNRFSKYKVGDKFGNGCEIIEFLRYDNRKEKIWLVKCHCGEEWELFTHHLSSVQECWTCAHKTSAEKISGENHWNYDENLTDEERRDNRKHAINRRLLIEFKENNPNCEKCGKPTEVVHHKNGWNLFPEQRDDINNFAALCQNCHIKFHKEFGQGNNTLKQFIKFMVQI